MEQRAQRRADIAEPLYRDGHPVEAGAQATSRRFLHRQKHAARRPGRRVAAGVSGGRRETGDVIGLLAPRGHVGDIGADILRGDISRSEERRVGKEWVSTCRSRGSTYLSQKKHKE